jgi:hypothetical protein
MPFKLKHKDSGLYWKGGCDPVLVRSKLNPSAWSKNGKSWNLKNHLSSALSPQFDGQYIGRTGITDFSKAEENYEWFKKETVIEFYQDAVEINFEDFKKVEFENKN